MKPRYLLAASAAAAAGAAIAVHRIESAWRAAEDPDGADFFNFPDGEATTVTTSDGASLATTVAGTGHTVVLAHGWTNSRVIWAPVARRLVASGHRVIAYDQRGHGESTVGSDPFTVSRLGADLAEVLTQLDVHDAVVAGHSMGGMTIMALIADDPDVLAERTRAVVLVSTAAGGLGRNPTVDKIGARVVGSERLARAMSGRFGPHLTRGAIGASPRASHLEEMARHWVATPRSTIRAAYEAIAVMDLREGLKECPVPATVIVGSRDQLTRKGLGQAIADRIPGATFTLLPGVGHMVPLEAPDVVVDAISRSWAGL